MRAHRHRRDAAAKGELVLDGVSHYDRVQIIDERKPASRSATTRPN
jgi:hypothetical protein